MGRARVNRPVDKFGSGLAFSIHNQACDIRPRVMADHIEAVTFFQHAHVVDFDDAQ
jgi:hypothetical protein